MEPAFNIDAAQVGGLTIIKIGRLTLCFALSREFRPIGSNPEAREEAKHLRRERQRRREAGAWARGFRAGALPGRAHRAG